jgi:signal transduction histidine kinase
MALLRSETLPARMRALAGIENLPADTEIAVTPPEVDTSAAFVSMPAGPQLPGWRLTLSLKNPGLFDSTTEHGGMVYLWTGLLVVGAMGILALLAARLVRRQMALARLKNDLTATVSHELKTPLSSMRVLVDTLLDSKTLDEPTVRDYLRLIAKENERLSRLIENFLTFSRMERGKHTLHLGPQPARQILDGAADAVRERFDTPGCCFEVLVEDDLPCVIADPDALTTALINLLDNAYKYSGDIKHIILRAGVANGKLVFSVEDNGIGIAPREAKRIFHAFYQVDQRLSRNGTGCGLGLSIVQYVVAAHHGEVAVNSRPGSGSTFTVSIPIASNVANARREAIA